eukprot:CAMPEP_0114262524 /NCGR_PEP_ID=MMETSP0058-20121206/21863_1 /TAXON_ID=36894 /ORGANISM="Pyramimonas parkeae, CCMP726" /LENGTH=89 /DNA_ID=CAMNT_0001378425 /DNA_START=224 /DNA_END=495 /DNA_ORIENTATION=-
MIRGQFPDDLVQNLRLFAGVQPHPTCVIHHDQRQHNRYRKKFESRPSDAPTDVARATTAAECEEGMPPEEASSGGPISSPHAEAGRTSV